jgi:hypothetical protein
MLTFHEHNKKKSKNESTEGGEGAEVDDANSHSQTYVFRRGEPSEPNVREDIPNAFPIYNYPEDPDADPMDTLARHYKEDPDDDLPDDPLDRLQYKTSPMESATHGVYSFFSLSQESANNLHAWCVAKGVPNPLPPEDLHSTVIWTPTNLPNYQPYPGPIVIEPLHFRLGTLGTAEKPVLVLFYDHPIPKEQWLKAKAQGANFTYAKYVEHITLSYDPSDFDFSQIGIPYMELTLEKEHVEALDPDKFKKEQVNTDFAKFLEELP